jgi:NDP-sugar pyrophosphorylase family protein
MEKIDAIILAGGKGKRLRSVVRGIPKPMAKVCGKPFLDILLLQLSRSGLIGKAVIAAGYKAREIIKRYSRQASYNFDITFCVEKKLLGTAGAIKKAIHFTRSRDVLVMNGDSYAEIDFKKLMAFHIKNRAKMTIALRKARDTSRYGNVGIDSDSRVVSFDEKKRTNRQNLVNAGVYLVKKNIFDGIKENEILSLENEAMPLFLRKFKNRIYGYKIRGKFIDIGTPESYLTADRYLKLRRG